MNKCLLPNKIEDFKKAIKGKDIKLSDLINLDHDEIIKKLQPYAGNNAEDIATMIEEKLVLKNRMLGIKNVISKLTKTGKYSLERIEEAKKALSDYRAAQQQRIFSPKEHESFLGGIADRYAGTHISREVAGNIGKLINNVSKAKESAPTALGISDEYFKAKDALDKYVEEQKPVDVKSDILNNLAVIGRNNLITGISTPIKTSLGQLTNSSLDMVSRRIGTGQFSGKNPELKKDIYKQVQSTFKETGRNGLGMESLDDSHFLGFGKKAEELGVPKGSKITGKDLGINLAKGIENVAKVSNQIAIVLEHQVPFTKFYQKAWLDMADLMSTKIAKSEGAEDIKGRSAEIFKDAVKIKPDTEEGKLLRKLCQEQAARITSTNDSVLSGLSLAIKNGMNHFIPMGEGKFFPLGNFIEPMAKIPATIISNSIENAGAGIPFGLKDIWDGRIKTQSEDQMEKIEGLSQMAKGYQRLARIGGSIGLAALIVNSIDKKDLKQDKWGNTFFKVGDTWVNTEYLSFVSAAMGGMIESKIGKSVTIEGKLEEYAEGSLKPLESLPGSNEVKGIVDALTSGHLVKTAQRNIGDFLTSRSIPQALREIFKHAETMPWFGPNTRPVNRLFFGAHGVESTEDVRQDKAQQKQKSREAKREMKNN